MKIVIAGGTGFLGAKLVEHWRELRHDVVVLTRGASAHGRALRWDGRTDGTWMRELDGADVVVNLAGRSVNCRYTPENLKEMMDSRVHSTEAIGRAIARAEKPPAVWLQMSTATLYAHTFGPLRTAMVMGRATDSVFGVLGRMTRWGLGGPIAGGSMYMSWIHEEDFERSLDFLIERSNLSGEINICAPNPLPQKDFMRIFRRQIGMPIGLPAAAWMVKIGAVFMRTDAELLLKSRRVVPKRLLESGFQFRFASWEDACADLSR